MPRRPTKTQTKPPAVRAAPNNAFDGITLRGDNRAVYHLRVLHVAGDEVWTISRTEDGREHFAMHLPELLEGTIWEIGDEWTAVERRENGAVTLARCFVPPLTEDRRRTLYEEYLWWMENTVEEHGANVVPFVAPKKNEES